MVAESDELSKSGRVAKMIILGKIKIRHGAKEKSRLFIAVNTMNSHGDKKEQILVAGPRSALRRRGPILFSRNLYWC